jgi:hypothetical protein
MREVSADEAYMSNNVLTAIEAAHAMRYLPFQEPGSRHRRHGRVASAVAHVSARNVLGMVLPRAGAWGAIEAMRRPRDLALPLVAPASRTPGARTEAVRPSMLGHPTAWSPKVGGAHPGALSHRA